MKKNLLLIIFLFISSYVSAQSREDVKSALKSIIDTHLEEKESNYMNECKVTSFYEKDSYLMVEGSFLHSGSVTNTWKPFVAKLRMQGDNPPRVIKVCYWKYWVLTGGWSLICTDGSNYIDPKPEKPSSAY